MGMMAFVSIIWILNVTLALSDGFRPTQFQTNNNLQLGEYLMQHTIQQSQSSITPSQSLGRSYMYISYFNLANSPFAAHSSTQCIQSIISSTHVSDVLLLPSTRLLHSSSLSFRDAHSGLDAQTPFAAS